MKKTELMDKGHEASGFTLVELLVTLAVIMVLAVLFLPTLNGGQRKIPHQLQCVNNMRQLSLAWLLYAGGLQWDAGIRRMA